MKILAFTDTHGKAKAIKKIIKKSKKADIIICAGDFTIFQHNMKKILKILESIGKPVFLIHGNHEDEKTTKKMCERLKNTKFIHKKESQIKGSKQLSIIGYGGGGFSLTDKEFEKFAKKYESKENLILVTHAPPYNTQLDKIGTHRGNKSITAFIKKAHPKLAICGHFHEKFRKQDKIGKTAVINPGPEGVLITVE